MDDVLIAYYGRILKRLAVSMGLQPANAEDVAQEVLAKLISSGKTFNGEEHRKAWLLRVGTNACNDFFRRVARKKDRLLYEGEMLADAGAIDSRFELLEVDQMFQKLDDHSRSILYMSCYEGMRSADIARALGMPPGTVRSKLKRIRQTIREEWRK